MAWSGVPSSQYGYRSKLATSDSEATFSHVVPDNTCIISTQLSLHYTQYQAEAALGKTSILSVANCRESYPTQHPTPLSRSVEKPRPGSQHLIQEERWPTSVYLAGLEDWDRGWKHLRSSRITAPPVQGYGQVPTCRSVTRTGTPPPYMICMHRYMEPMKPHPQYGNIAS